MVSLKTTVPGVDKECFYSILETPTPDSPVFKSVKMGMSPSEQPAKANSDLLTSKARNLVGMRPSRAPLPLDRSTPTFTRCNLDLNCNRKCGISGMFNGLYEPIDLADSRSQGQDHHNQYLVPKKMLLFMPRRLLTRLLPVLLGQSQKKKRFGSRHWSSFLSKGVVVRILRRKQLSLLLRLRLRLRLGLGQRPLQRPLRKRERMRKLQQTRLRLVWRRAQIMPQLCHIPDTYKEK